MPFLAFSQSVTNNREQGIELLSNLNYKEAKKYFDKALLENPKDIEARIKRAYCYYSLNQYKNCISDINKIQIEKLELDQKYQLIRMRGESYSYSQQFDKAIEDLNKFLSIYYDVPHIIVLKGKCLISVGKLDEAINDLNYVLKLKMVDEETVFDSWKWLSIAYRAKGETKSSINPAVIAYKLDSTDKDIIYNLLEGYYYDSKYDSSDFYIKKFRDTDPNNLAANYISAMNNYYRMEYKEAIKKFDYYFSIKGKSKDAYYYRSICKLNTKDYNGSIADIKAYVNLDPKDPWGYNQIAWVFFKMGKAPEGLIYVNKAILMAPKEGNFIDTKGCIYYQMKDYASAIKEFDLSIKLDSTTTNSYYYRGLALLKENKLKEACNDWRIVIEDKDYKEHEGEKPTLELISENCKR